MNTKPIIIIAGEPYSIFSEIFFKSLLKYKLKKKLILIGSRKLFESQMKHFGYNFKFKQIPKKFESKQLLQNYINIINVNFHYKKIFDKISDKSNLYIKNSFDIALHIVKNHKISGLINGPISKKHFLNKNFLGITEYLAKKTKTNKYAMIIYNKFLSVCPITTHLPIKHVAEKISKKMIVEKIIVINKFYLKNFKKKPRIAITGLNPHCESNHKFNEEIKIIKPSIKDLKKNGINVLGPYPADTIFLKKIE